MRIWFDTEFIEDGKTIDLLSIGMIREDGAEYYAEIENVHDTKNRADPWLWTNVYPHFNGPEKSREQIAKEIQEFAGPNPEFWAYFAAYDWVVLCQLYGRMIDLPKNWPMFCLDLKQLMYLWGVSFSPIQKTKAHDALADARWTKETWEWMDGLIQQLREEGRL